MIDDKPEKPYSYVKYIKTKNHRELQLDGGTKVSTSEDVCYLNVDGCHGTVEALTELEKSGAVIIGCGFGDKQMNHSAKNQAKRGQVVNFVSRRVGATVDPKVMQAAQSAIQQKIKEKSDGPRSK